MTMHLDEQERMFYRIRDFAVARNARQAVGFYLFHLLVGLAGAALALSCYKFVFGLPKLDGSLVELKQITIAIAAIYVAWLCFSLLRAKGRLGQPRMWVFSAVSVMMAMAGMLMGLIIPACLSILQPVHPREAAGDFSVSEEEQS